MSSKSHTGKFYSELKNVFYINIGNYAYIFTGHSQDMLTQNCKEINNFPMYKLILVIATTKTKKLLWCGDNLIDGSEDQFETILLSK